MIIHALVSANFLSPGLHWSCKLARVDLARVLLSAGSDINARSHSGHSPLHLAAQTGQRPLIHLLIQHGFWD